MSQILLPIVNSGLQAWSHWTPTPTIHLHSHALCRLHFISSCFSTVLSHPQFKKFTLLFCQLYAQFSLLVRLLHLPCIWTNLVLIFAYCFLTLSLASPGISVCIFFFCFWPALHFKLLDLFKLAIKLTFISICKSVSVFWHWTLPSAMLHKSPYRTYLNFSCLLTSRYFY